MSSYFECLLNGAAIGFSIAAPVGPIGLLCIRKTLENGFRIGLFCGLGAALADALYGVLAALGLVAMLDTNNPVIPLLRFVSAFFLIWLGFKIASSTPVTAGNLKLKTASPLSAIATTFLLTLSNPMTILSFSAILCSNAASCSSASSPLLMVLGIFAGSCLWWVILAKVTALIGHVLTPKALSRLNYASGGLIALFGLKALLPI